MPTPLLGFAIARNFDPVLIFFVSASLTFEHFFVNGILVGAIITLW